MPRALVALPIDRDSGDITIFANPKLVEKIRMQVVQR